MAPELLFFSRRAAAVLIRQMKVLQRHAWALARISMRPLKVAAVIVAIDATARPEGCDRSFDLPPISVGTTNLCRKGQNLS